MRSSSNGGGGGGAAAQPSPARVALQGLAATAAAAARGGAAPAFMRVSVPLCDATTFPPALARASLLLPALPAPATGPAPVAWGGGRDASAAGNAGGAGGAAAMDSLWLAAAVQAQAITDGAASRPAGASASATRARGGGGGALDGAAPPVDSLGASAPYRRLLASLSAARGVDERRGLRGAAAAAHRLRASPLAQENARIRRALVGGGRGGGGGGGGGGSSSAAGAFSLRADGLERLLRVERLEVQAAIAVQRWWRRELRRRFWRAYAAEQAAAVVIQGAWRGHVAGLAARAKLAAARALVRSVGAWWRGAVVRAGAEAARAYTRAAAVDMQRLARGAAGRRAAQRLRADRAAVVLQAWWRGVRGRAEADRRALDAAATAVQRMVRGMLAARRVRAERAASTAAAVAMQAAVRGWLARADRARRLWAAETAARSAHLAVLAARSRAAAAGAAAAAADARARDAPARAFALEGEWAAACEVIEAREVALLVTERDLAGAHELAHADADLAPALLNTAVKAHAAARARLTDAKAAALFRIAMPLRRLREEEEQMREQAEDIAFETRRIDERMRELRADSFHRELAMERARKRHALVRRTGDERRRWAIEPITDSGKPDLRKRELLRRIRAKQQAAAGMAEGGGRSSAGGLGDGEGGDDGLLLTAEGVAGPFGGLAHADAISLASWWAADGADAAPAGTQASAALQQLDAKIRALIAAAERQPVCGSAPALPLPPPFPPPSLPDRVQLLALSDAATSLDTSAGLHMRDLLPAGQAAALSALRGLGLRAADLDDASDEQTDEGDAQRPATVRRAGAASAARSELGRICARQGGAGGSSGAFSSTALVTAAPQSTAMTVAAATPCVARTPLPTPALNQVPTVAQEREAATAAAAADDARLGARVQRLLGVVATVNAEAEMLQYGALLKPLLESTTHVMANAVAADGTAGVLQRALQQRQARAQDAQARVGTVLRKAQHERRAAAAARYGLKEVLPPSPTAVTLAAAGDAAADDFVIPAPSRPASAGGMRRGGGRNTGDTLDGGDDDDEDGNEDGGSSGRLLQPPPLPAPPAPAHRVAPVSPPPAAPPPPAAIIFSADDDAATTATHSVGGERRTSAMQLGAALAVLAGGAGSSRGSDADRRRRQTATSAANSRDAALRRFAATHRAHEAAKAQQRVDFDADQAAKEQADAAAEARQLARQRRAVDLAALMRGKQAARRHQAAAAAPQASSEQQQLPPPPPPLPQLAIDVDDSSLPSPAHSPMTPGSPPALLTLRSARSVIPSAPLPALRRATSVVPWDLLEDLEGDRARLAEG